MIKISDFGKLSNKLTSHLLEIDLECGIKAKLCDYGAAIMSLIIPGGGVYREVLCGFDSISRLSSQKGYIGATVGRYANRIANGEFELNGKKIILAKNDGGRHHLHGGNCGFDKYIWKFFIEKDEPDFAVVRFSHYSPDGDEGYPGNLFVSVTYTIDKHGLKLKYSYFCDSDSVCNMTNHAYFNLDGFESDVRLHTLTLFASNYAKTNEFHIPLSHEPVRGTAFDFLNPKTIENDFDHSFDVDGYDGTLRRAAVLVSSDNRLRMTVNTTCPAVQLYTGNSLGNVIGNDRLPIGKNAYLCLETHYPPDCLNSSFQFKPYVRSGVDYESHTEYLFDAIK